jgi:hypothetical protein
MISERGIVSVSFLASPKKLTNTSLSEALEQCQKKLILLFVVAAQPQPQTTGQPF